MRDTKEEETIDTRNHKKNPLSPHKDQYQYYKENTKQIFLCLQTKFRNCDHLVTLFHLYQNWSKRNVAYFRYPSVLHSITRMEYKVENTTANHLIDYWKEEAQQTADHFSENKIGQVH